MNQQDLKKRKQTMQLSVIEGSFYSLMVGFAQYFITPFAVFLGLSNFAIGILRSISTLFSGIGFYSANWLYNMNEKRKEFISKYVLYQAYILLLFPVLIILPFDKSIPLIIIYSVFLFLGSLVSPIWTSLMGQVVLRQERGSYFGTRNKITGFFELSGSLVAGAILTFFTNNPIIGFSFIFIAAAFFRFVSSRLILKHWEPKKHLDSYKPKIGDILYIKDKYLRNLIMLGGGMLFATNIAGPFFAIFMLRDLHFSYLDFTIATIASTLATLISQPYWGKLIDRYGTRPVLFSTTLLIPFIPLLWIPAADLSYVILIQFYSGVVWAGFDLAVFNMLLKISPNNKTHVYSSLYNSLITFLTFLGMLIGSFMIYFVDSLSLGFIAGIQIIFLISGILRFIVAALALPRITKKMQVNSLSFFLKTITVYPIKGILSEVELGILFAESTVVSSSKLLRNPVKAGKDIVKDLKSFLKQIE